MTDAAPAARKNSGLMYTLKNVRHASGGKRLSFGGMLLALENLGFGPLLFIPTVLIMLPTGAIPFVPGIAAVFMILVAVQIIIGRRAPWLPERMQKMSISAKEFDGAVKKAAPAIRRVDSMTKKRAAMFTGTVFQKVAAVLIILQSVLVMAIGVIPFLPDLLVAPIFLLALGFTARDGLLSIVGLSLLVITGAVAMLTVIF